MARNRLNSPGVIASFLRLACPVRPAGRFLPSPNPERFSFDAATLATLRVPDSDRAAVSPGISKDRSQRDASFSITFTATFLH